MNNLRKQFPFFQNHPDGIYFDSASTTQKPKIVIDAVQNYLANDCANAGRGSYPLANKVTNQINQIRTKVASFINANNPEEIVFTSGATAGLNTICYAWGLHNLKDGDEILYGAQDHHSAILPLQHLQSLLARQGVQIKLIPFQTSSAGDPSVADIKNKITARTRLISLTHIHNVFGAQAEVQQVRSLAPHSILICLDTSQSVGHLPVDVQELGVDFAIFSGHKMFASTGIGVLWVDQQLHSQLQPFMLGGGSVDPQSNQLKTMPHLLEAGTDNIVGIISLGAAIDFIESIGSPNIHAHNLHLTQYLIQHLRSIPKVSFLPGPAYSRCAVGYGIVSFNIAELPSQEVGFILSEHQIYVRTGSHCTPTTESSQDSIRVSMHLYNTTQEIDRLIEVLKTLVE